jgi:hypothetical protein
VCDFFGSPHFWHFVKLTGVILLFAAVRFAVRRFEVFFFGTAMSLLLVARFTISDYQVSIGFWIYEFRILTEFILLYFFIGLLSSLFAFTGAIVQIFATFLADSDTILFAEILNWNSRDHLLAQRLRYINLELA